MEEVSPFKSNFNLFHLLLAKTHRVFGNIDAAGKTIQSIFELKGSAMRKKYAIAEEMQMFWANLEVYGSVQPILSSNIHDYKAAR